MGISPAEEKRQEEKRIKELRDFQRSNPANRRCFDCNEMVRGRQLEPHTTRLALCAVSMEAYRQGHVRFDVRS